MYGKILVKCVIEIKKMKYYYTLFDCLIFINFLKPIKSFRIDTKIRSKSRSKLRGKLREKKGIEC